MHYTELVIGLTLW